jgi:hypothetical protein
MLWINPLGGDWDNPLNWLGGVPGAGDQAIINLPGTFTVTHSSSAVDSVQSVFSTHPLNLSAGSLSLGSASTIYTLDLSGGTLTALGSLSPQLFTWTGGTLSGSGPVNVSNFMLLSGVGPMTLDGATLNNLGSAAWTSGNMDVLSSGTFNNLAGGTFTDQSSGTFHPTFNNSGTFSLTGGAISRFDSLNNSGTVTLNSGTLDALNYSQAGGVTKLGGNVLNAANVTWTGGTISGSGALNITKSLLLSGAAPMALDGSTINNYGKATWTAGNIATSNEGTFNNLAGATFTAQSNATFLTIFNNVGTFTLAGSATTSIDTLVNYGTVALQSGTLDTTNFTQPTGTTFLGGNTLGAINPVQISGGSLVGPGTIKADLINSGLITPGAVGAITINGNFTQTAAGSLWFAIGGPSVGKMDFMRISGAAALDGSLNAYFINGFSPNLSASYPIIFSGSRNGTFYTVTILNPNPSVNLGTVYNPNGVVIGAVPPPPLNNNTASLGSGVSYPALLSQLIFTQSFQFGDSLPDATIRSLALGRVSGSTTVETGFWESLSKSELGVFTTDFRHGAAAGGMEESGADDDLLAAFLAASSELERLMDSEPLSGSDIAVALLIGLRPRADILPQKGPRLASVATLLPGDAGEEALAQAHAGAEENLSLADFLINPVRRIPPPRPNTAIPQQKDAGETGRKRSDAGADAFLIPARQREALEEWKDGRRRTSWLSAVTGLASCSLLLGTTIGAERRGNPFARAGSGLERSPVRNNPWPQENGTPCGIAP